MTKPVKPDPLASAAPSFPPLPNPFTSPAVDSVVRPILNDSHSSPPARPIIKKVALNDRPTSPPPPPEAAAAPSSTDSNLFYFKFSPNGPVLVPPPPKTGTVPFNAAYIQACITQAEIATLQGKSDQAFGHYFTAMHHFNFSHLDSNGLLLRALCLLKLCKFMRESGNDDKIYIQEVLEVIDQLEEALLKASAPEKTDPIFMYSLGSVYLTIGRFGLNPAHNLKARNYFLGALKLSPPAKQDSKILKHKILLGLGASYLYQVRSEILNSGTKKKDRLHDFLRSSRTHLTQAIALHTHPTVQYLIALNYGFTNLLLNEEASREIKEGIKENLCLEAEDQLMQGLGILSPMPDKNEETLALYGCLLYQEAFDQKDVDYVSAWKALKVLSEALPHLDDDAIPLSTGDAARQLAWVSPNFQCQAENYLEEAVQSSNVDKVLSKSNQLVFYIQRAFWLISEANQKLLDSKKPAQQQEVNLEDLMKKCIVGEVAQRRREILQDLKQLSSLERRENCLKNLRRLEGLKKTITTDLMIAQAHKTSEAFITSFKDDLRIVEILRKTALVDLRAKTINELKTHAKELHALAVSKSDNAYFHLLKGRIRECIELLITDLDQFPPQCDSQEELREFNKFAWKTGNELDSLFFQTLYKYMLMERFRHLDLVLDLEIPVPN